MKALATVICKRAHRAEWKAPYPRINPCARCFVLAEEIHHAGWRKP